jgi:small subunit ribosomal protein S1
MDTNTLNSRTSGENKHHEGYIMSEETIIPTPDTAVEAPVVHTEVVAQEVPKPAPIVTAHDDFDWSVDKRNVVHYSESERVRYDEQYGMSIHSLEDNQIVKGVVVAVTHTDVVFQIGFKADGLVPISEFRDQDGVNIGESYDVYVVSKEDKKGHLILSRKNAKLLKAWEQIVSAAATGEIVTGKVISKTKGGLIANVFGLETFLPGSQIDVKPITDYDLYVGKTLELKVVKINEAIKNAVVSHKALIESDIESQREEIIGKLEKGQVLEGTIKNITDFGAFIDLGGVDGLLYITDISWGRITHPNEVLQINQKLNVVVLDYDDHKKRISLGLKQLQAHPWDTLDASIEVGSKVSGRIVNIEDYGAFLEITPGVEGLIHVSEVSWSSAPTNSREHFKSSETHEAIVMTLDREERKMSLSLKRLTEDPWNKVSEKYPVGTRITGVVKNLTPYGVFVELSDGIGGMVHISDLSWTKRFNHPSEFTKAGAELDVVVLEIDNENRKLSLGHKQIEEDPWDTFETVFPVGSVHEASVMVADDKGATILLPYGLEGYAPKKHLSKETGGFLGADDKAEFRVIEFNRNDKRILLSHARMWEEVKRETVEKERTERKVETEKATKKVKDIQKSIEKSTLGDLSALSDLKEKMENTGKEEAKAKMEAMAAKVDAAKVEAPATETPVEASLDSLGAEPKPKAKATKVKGTPVEDIEGVGEAYKAKLNAIEIFTVEELLERGGTKKGRKEIAEKSEIAEGHILTWVNHADLFRLNGVAGQYAELLEAAGVDTVKELRHRNAENLTVKMEEVNAEKNLVNKLPSQAQVEKWIEEAKTLDPAVSH